MCCRSGECGPRECSQRKELRLASAHGRLLRTNPAQRESNSNRWRANEPTRSRKFGLHAAWVKLRATWQSASPFSVDSLQPTRFERVVALLTSSMPHSALALDGRLRRGDAKSEVDRSTSASEEERIEQLNRSCRWPSICSTSTLPEAQHCGRECSRDFGSREE